MLRQNPFPQRLGAPATLLLAALLLPIASLARPAQSERDIFAASISVLDLFMQAGQADDVRQAAQWMQVYESYPPRAINQSHTLIKRNREVFANYLSVREDVYGYEIKRQPLQTKIYIEGAVHTVDGAVSEFAAELVYRFRKWRIQSLEID